MISSLRWCLVLAAVAQAACRPAEQAQSDDPRTRLVLPVEAEDAVRAEMRTMLASVHAILIALPARDTTAIRAAAMAAGTPAAADTALEDLLPARFMTLGMATHGGFDSLAAAAASLGPDSVAAQLGRITANCIACHAEFRLAP